MGLSVLSVNPENRQYWAIRLISLPTEHPVPLGKQNWVCNTGFFYHASKLLHPHMLSAPRQSFGIVVL